MKKILLLIVSLFALHQLSNAQTLGCHAAFGYYQVQGTTNYVFYDSCTSSSGAFSYNRTHITIGNNAPIHFNHNTTQTASLTAGTYVVCMVVTDSVNYACYDSTCISITVGNSGGSSCSTSFSYSNVDSLYSFTPTSWNGTAPYSYHWLIQDGSTTLYSGNSANPSIVLQNGHSVYVTLNSTDSVGCTSIDSSYVYASFISNASCNAAFILWQDTSLQHTYDGYNLSTGSNLQYIWNWGDGTTSNIATPQHTYGSTGFYTICLYVFGANCSDTFCMNSFSVNKMTAKSAVGKIQIKSKSATGVEELTAAALSPLNIYPNPASSELTIDLKGEKIQSTKVMNISGQLVLQSVSSNSKINISELPANIYFVEVKTANNIYRSKFVKQ